jgi:hypothetical protein
MANPDVHDTCPRCDGALRRDGTSPTPVYVCVNCATRWVRWRAPLTSPRALCDTGADPTPSQHEGKPGVTVRHRSCLLRRCSEG